MASKETLFGNVDRQWPDAGDLHISSSMSLSLRQVSKKLIGELKRYHNTKIFHQTRRAGGDLPFV